MCIYIYIYIYHNYIYIYIHRYIFYNVLILLPNPSVMAKSPHPPKKGRNRAASSPMCIPLNRFSIPQRLQMSGHAAGQSQVSWGRKPQRATVAARRRILWRHDTWEAPGRVTLVWLKKPDNKTKELHRRSKKIRRMRSGEKPKKALGLQSPQVRIWEDCLKSESR